jgi:predicted permease
VAFPAPDTELWLPMRLDPAKTESASFDYRAIARLRDGVSIDAAAADLQTLLPRLPDEFPGRLTRASLEQTQMRTSVRPLAAVIIGDIGLVLWVVLAAAALVLAIACANVANLFLVRAESRRDAVAVKRALGAASRTLILESLAEGFLVAAIGGALGLIGAQLAIDALRSVAGVVDVPRLAEVNIDAAVLAVAGAATLFAAVCISSLPAWRAARGSRSSLLSSSRFASTGRERHRLRQALVGAQVALALVLLVGSGLMARSVWRLRSVQTGFDATGAVSFRLALPQATYPQVDDLVRFFVRVEDTLGTVPGVTAVGSVSKLPLDEQGRTDSAVFIEDRPIPAGSLPGIHPVSYVTPGYFESAGIPFLSGRAFARPDPPRVLPEAIVSRGFAERYWKNESPIGKRVRIFQRGPWYTIVGVVGSVRDTALDRAADETLYCPLLPAREDPRWAPRDLAVVVRTAGEPTSIAAIRDVIRGLDPSVPVYRHRPLSDLVAEATARRTFTLLLVAAASGVALLLGAVGLYGVMSYVVTLRKREVGVRLALGAQPAEIRRMISRQGLSVALLGIVAGLAVATALTRLLASVLFEVSPTDPVVLGVAATSLVVVAGIASWLPARRAAAVDPSLALRAE